MIDLTRLLVSKCDTEELNKLERAIRKELRERAVDSLSETPRPTPEEFAMLKENPSVAMRKFRLRTGLTYYQTQGIFHRLYGIPMY